MYNTNEGKLGREKWKYSLLLYSFEMCIWPLNTHHVYMMTLWGSVEVTIMEVYEVKGKAVLPFDIWLHYEVILFYPTLASRCISLN